MITTVRKNIDIKYVIVKHTETLNNINGVDINNNSILLGLFGAQCDILINQNGFVDISPVWIHASNSTMYKQNVPISSLCKDYEEHHILNTDEDAQYVLQGVHIGVIGDFNITSPSSAQIHSLKKVLQNLQEQLSIEKVLYHNDITITSSPGRFFPTRQSMGIVDVSNRQFLTPLLPKITNNTNFKIILPVDTTLRNPISSSKKIISIDQPLRNPVSKNQKITNQNINIVPFARAAVATPGPQKRFQIDTVGDLTTGLIAYYKAEDTTDFYNSNDLTNIGGATFVAGKINNCVQPAKTGSKYLKRTSAISSITSNFSMAAWVFVAATNIWGGVFHCGQGNGWGFGVGIGVSQAVGGNRIVAYCAGSWLVFQPQIGTGWKLLIVTRDATTWRAYINGVVSPTTFTNNVTTPTTATYVGAVNPSSLELSDMKEDEIAVWERCLSQQNITDLNNNGDGQTMIIS